MHKLAIGINNKKCTFILAEKTEQGLIQDIHLYLRIDGLEEFSFCLKRARVEKQGGGQL